MKELIVKLLKEHGLKFSMQTASNFTGTSGCMVKHPTYGDHKVTIEQMKYSSGDYKDLLFENMIIAVAIDLDISGYDSAYFQFLDETERHEVHRILKEEEIYV